MWDLLKLKFVQTTSWKTWNDVHYFLPPLRAYLSWRVAPLKKYTLAYHRHILKKKNDSFVPSAWQTVDISLWINFCEDLVSNFLHLTHSRCLLCFFITSRFPFTPVESLHCLVFKLFFPSLHGELQLSIVASVLNNTIIWAEVPLGLWRSLREILFVSF